jgi:hypothetical protein
MKANLLFSIFLIATLLSGCAGLTPEFYKTVDDVATDGVVTIQLDKEAFEQKDADVIVHVSITKKDKN